MDTLPSGWISMNVPRISDTIDIIARIRQKVNKKKGPLNERSRIVPC